MFTLILALTVSSTSISNKDLAISAGSLAAFGCIKSGIGAVVHDQSLVRGCLYGVVGAGFEVAGNYLVSNAEKKGFGALGKLSNDIGISIQDNVMLGGNVLDSFTTDISFISLTVGKNAGIKWNITPVVGLMSFGFNKQLKFNWQYSLYNLTPIFVGEYPIYKDNLYYAGLTLGNTIFTIPVNSTLNHELIHTLQWSRMRSSYYLGNTISLIRIPQEFGGWNISRDIVSNTLYGISNINRNCYYNNPLELEAYRWTD